MNTDAAKIIFEKLRAQSGFNETSLSLRAGLSHGYLNYWLTNAKNVKRVKIEPMLRILGHTWAQFEAMVEIESGVKYKSNMPLHGDNFSVIPMPKNVTIEPIDLHRREVRRDDLPVFKIVSADTPGAVAVPAWQGLRCGEGGNIEPCDKEFFLGAPRGEGVNCMRLCGESMEPTFSAGDKILVRNMGPIVLPSLDVGNGEFANVRRVIERDVTHKELYIVRINNEPPQLKRVEFLGDDLDWHLLILPDNHIFAKYLVKKTDEVTFYAKVLGRAKP